MTTTLQTLVPNTEHFEALYVEAHGRAELIPWADEHAAPALTTWLNAIAPSLIRCGARVAVVGCGLGQDARELIQRGYEVTAFDCSHTAVEWARRLDAGNEHCYVQADLFELPARWRHRFDLVVEINTIQMLPMERRGETLAAIAELLSQRGHLLVICRGAEEPVNIDDGPPWAMTEDELLEAAGSAGLVPSEMPVQFDDDQTPPVRRMRAVFVRT
jgi:SAM-dependent methyltransferase